MNADLVSAQECLKIRQVNLRELKVQTKDEACPRNFDLSKLKRQTFSIPDKVTETELSDSQDESVSFLEYKFNQALGIRLVDPDLISEEQDDDSNEHVIFEIIAIFEAEYVSKKELTDDEIEAFSKSNAGFHIWPYWRELVQSTCTRVGMSSPIDIPTYKVS